MAKDLWDILGIVVVPVIVALIVSGIPAIVQGRKFRNENTSQHNSVTAKLEGIGSTLKELDKTIDRVETKIDEHVGRHKENERLKAAGRI